MSKLRDQAQSRKITFSREGLVQAVAGIMCAMARDAQFSSAHLSKFIQHIYGSLLSAEFTQLVELEIELSDELNDESRAELIVESFKIHGQSLQNLVQYWNDELYIEKTFGEGRQSLYTVTERGLRHFMGQVYFCEIGLNELRTDYLLLSLYTIRSTPLSILQEVHPGLESSWTSEDGGSIAWQWNKARDRFTKLLKMRRKSTEDFHDMNDQLPEIISKAKKAAVGAGVAGVIGSLLVVPAALSLPLVGYFAYRSQRDKQWGKGLRVLANMYQSFRPSFAKHDMDEGLQYRSSILYAPMSQILGQVIRTLERLK